MQASSALATGTLAAPNGRALAQNPGEIRVLTYGGEVAKAITQTLAKPFEAETGIRVNPITQNFDFASLELLVRSNNVSIDVGPMSQGSSGGQTLSNGHRSHFFQPGQIKPHIRKWWMSGSEIQQLMLSGSGKLMMSYYGRARSSIDRGAPLEMSRNQAKLIWDCCVIPKGSPNVSGAQKFVEFASRAENQAAFTKLFPLGPTNRNALKHLPEEIALKLPSHPKYMAKSILLNGRWYAETGADGLTNSQRLVQRWSDWVLK